MQKDYSTAGTFKRHVSNRSLQSAVALQTHFKTKKHLEAARVANGGTPVARTAHVVRLAAAVAVTKAHKRHYCTVCDKACNYASHLSRHYKSKPHKRAVTAAAAEDLGFSTVADPFEHSTAKKLSDSPYAQAEGFDNLTAATNTASASGAFGGLWPPN